MRASPEDTRPPFFFMEVPGQSTMVATAHSHSTARSSTAPHPILVGRQQLSDFKQELARRRNHIENDIEALSKVRNYLRSSEQRVAQRQQQHMREQLKSIRKTAARHQGTNFAHPFSFSGVDVEVLQQHAMEMAMEDDTTPMQSWSSAHSMVMRSRRVHLTGGMDPLGALSAIAAKAFVKPHPTNVPPAGDQTATPPPVMEQPLISAEATTVPAATAPHVDTPVPHDMSPAPRVSTAESTDSMAVSFVVKLCLRLVKLADGTVSAVGAAPAVDVAFDSVAFDSVAFDSVAFGLHLSSLDVLRRFRCSKCIQRLARGLLCRRRLHTQRAVSDARGLRERLLKLEEEEEEEEEEVAGEEVVVVEEQGEGIEKGVALDEAVGQLQLQGPGWHMRLHMRLQLQGSGWLEKVERCVPGAHTVPKSPTLPKVSHVSGALDSMPCVWCRSEPLLATPAGPVDSAIDSGGRASAKSGHVRSSHVPSGHVRSSQVTSSRPSDLLRGVGVHSSLCVVPLGGMKPRELLGDMRGLELG